MKKIVVVSIVIGSSLAEIQIARTATFQAGWMRLKHISFE